MDKTDYFDKVDAVVYGNKLTKNLNVTQCQHFSMNLTAKYNLCLKRLTLLTLNRTLLTEVCSTTNIKTFGLTKLHKPGTPMRPIVSFCGSPTYQLSKYLKTILQPRCKLQSMENLIDAIKTVQIPDDHESFDVKSLFTSIPLQLALQCTKTANKTIY